MKTACKHCHTALRAEDIDLDRLVGKCPACASLFDVSDQVAGNGSRHQRRTAVPLPRGLSVVEDARGRLAIVRRWFRPGVHPFALLLALLWNGGLVYYLSEAGLSAAHPAPLTLVLILVAGIIGGYLALAGLLNRTAIRVEKAALSIHHTPLPWTGTQRFAAQQFTELRCEPESLPGQSRSTVYHLTAVDRLGRKTRLLSNLGTADQALYLEQRIEEHLGLSNVGASAAAPA